MIDKRKENLKNFLLLISLLVLFFPIYKIFLLIENIPTVSILINAFNEVRDYTSFRLTHLIMTGQNPYSTDILMRSTTPFMNLYTVLNPLIVAIFCKITSFRIITGYYVVNFLIYILVALNIWLIVKDFFEKNEKFIVIVIVCLLINSATFFAMFGLPIFNFRPDSIGIFITSLIFLIVYKNRNRIVTLSLLSVMLIFTKQVLCVMFVPLFMYYLVIHEKKNAMKYLLCCVILGFITLTATYIVFPLYWTETIFSQFLIVEAWGSLYHSIYNLLYFYYRYSMPLLLIVVGILASNKRISISNIIRNLISQDKFAIYLLLNLFLGTIFLIYFAKVGGDGYKYCQDILAPSTFLLMMYIWHNYFARHWNFNKSKLKASTLLFILCVSTSITYFHFKFTSYSVDDIKSHTELDQIIDAHQKEKIYLGMNSTQYMLKRDIWESDNIWFNDGHIEYFAQYLNKDDDTMLDTILHIQEIKHALSEHFQTINWMIKNKDFGLITTCGAKDGVIDSNLLDENYYPYNSYDIRTDTNGIFTVTIWLPK